MTKEITFILEPDSGNLTTEVSGMSTAVLTDLRDDLGTSQNVNCGKPHKGKAVNLHASNETASDDNQFIWLYRIYHNSVVDGPGRRSVVQVSGCSIRCPGCYVPDTHDRHNGKLVSVSSVVREVLSRSAEHDGVTILGGEPFDQAGPVAEMVSRLNRFNQQILVYSGNTLVTLIARHDPCVDYILTHIDVLIDGPFEQFLNAKTGEYRGSSNQQLYGWKAGYEKTRF